MSERTGDWIQTYTGRQFWPLDPRPEDFDPEDIAHALAMKCRFNGHSREFYSVAEHSVYVSRECERRYPDQPWKWLWGLLHDIGEAYLPDVPRPIKHMGVGILQVAEKEIVFQAAQRFGLHGGQEPATVKVVDSAVLAAEAAQIMQRPPNGCNWYLPEPAADVRIWCWSPWTAKRHFLERWRQLDADLGIHALRQEPGQTPPEAA